MKNSSEDEIRLIDEIREIKINLVAEIESSIEKFLKNCEQTPTTVNKIGYVDVLGALELVKVRFVENVKFTIERRDEFNGR